MTLLSVIVIYLYEDVGWCILFWCGCSFTLNSCRDYFRKIDHPHNVYLNNWKIN